MSINYTGTSKDQRVKEHSRRELLAKYLYDVSKITLTSWVLIALLPMLSGNFEVANIVRLSIGAWVTFGFAWMANRILIY